MKVVFIYTGEEYLGIEYLSAVLKEKGHVVQLIYDPLLFNDYYISSRLLSRLFSFHNRILKEVAQSGAGLVAFSVNTAEYEWALRMSSEIKNRINVPIVFGGHHSTCVPEEVIKEGCVDFVIEGEGEYSFLELVECLEGKKIKESVSNLYYKVGKCIYRNELRPLIENLDSLPFPDKELFYGVIKYQEGNYTIITSRGCPYSCSYCHNYYIRKKYSGKGEYVRRRSVVNVIDELRRAKKKYKVKSIMFQDEIFTLDTQWLAEFAGIFKKEINLPYACYVHPDTINDKTVSLLRDSGCVSVNIGIESIDDSVRRNLLYRSIEQGQIINTLGLLNKNHIHCRAYFIIGLPGQNESDLINLARFCNENRLFAPIIFWLHYFPGTKIAELYDNKPGKINRKCKNYGYGLGGDVFDNVLSKIKFLIILTSFLSKRNVEYIIQSKIYRIFPAHQHYFFSRLVVLIRKVCILFVGKSSKNYSPKIAYMPIGRRYRYFILRMFSLKKNVGITVIKKTVSLCPVCYAIISAKIVQDAGNVLMKKECSNHGKFTALIDTDIHYYSRLINNDKKRMQHKCLKACPKCYIEGSKSENKVAKRIKPYCCLMLPVSYACNLNCNFCYLPQRHSYNLSFEELKRIITNFNGNKISLTGGEPTLRDDLPDLIALIKKTGKDISLATNGLRLSDLSYTKLLKAAGLSSLVFSLNGLDDSVFLKIEKVKLLNTKLKALENLKREKIKVQVSVTLVRGVNEGELEKIYRYCLNNLDFITDLRIRNASAVGLGSKSLPLSGSEILGFVSHVVGVGKNKLINDFERNINYSSSSVFNIMLYFKNGHNSEMIGFDTNMRKDRYLPWAKKMIFARKYFKNKMASNFLKGESSRLLISIIYWSTKYNIDIQEADYSVLHHLTRDGRILPFNCAIIDNERYLNEDITNLS